MLLFLDNYTDLKIYTLPSKPYKSITASFDDDDDNNNNK
jgi:hypothetical protein